MSDAFTQREGCDFVFAVRLLRRSFWYWCTLFYNPLKNVFELYLQWPPDIDPSSDPEHCVGAFGSLDYALNEFANRAFMKIEAGYHIDAFHRGTHAGFLTSLVMLNKKLDPVCESIAAYQEKSGAPNLSRFNAIKQAVSDAKEGRTSKDQQSEKDDFEKCESERKLRSDW